MTTNQVRPMPDMYTPADQWLTFGEWCERQTHFARFDRDDTEIDSYIVVPYTYYPNVATLLDDSNHAALLAIMQEADPTGEDYTMRRHGHWATDYEMLLVRPGSAAFDAADGAIAALADYPVLDETDYSEREYEAALDNIKLELLRTTIVGADGAELNEMSELAGELFSWFWDNDQSAVKSRDGNGGWPSSEQIEDGLLGLGYTCDDDGGPWVASTTE